MSGTTSYHAGYSAEQVVADHYLRENHEIAAQRWRGAGGEIDLIARDGDTVIFVEVKKSKSFAQAALRLQHRQMQRIMVSASEFLGGEPNGQLTDVRFDVALVNSFGAVEVIENAFGDM